MNYLRNRKNAFYFAFSGLWAAMRREPHMRIHVVATVLVTLAGFYFKITKMEWVAVLACITLVLVLELINTALEKICDLVHPHQHPTVKYIKDIAAAAVLLACIFAVLTGLLIFLPYLL